MTLCTSRDVQSINYIYQNDGDVEQEVNNCQFLKSMFVVGRLVECAKKWLRVYLSLSISVENSPVTCTLTIS